MSNTHLAFFSSDFSPLYKADIYRCLALPTGYTIQFRYRPDQVHKLLRGDLKKIKSRDGIIYFAAGNDPEKPEQERELEFYAVRRCKVVDPWQEDDIDQITFILELHEFVSYRLDSTRVPGDLLPPKIYVSEVSLDHIYAATWMETVRSVEAHFADLLFCYIPSVLRRRLLRKAKPLSVKYSSALKHSYFSLKEDSQYAIRCVCYDPKSQNRLLLIRNQSNEIEVSNSFESGVGAGDDVRLLPLGTRVLKTHSVQSFLTFYSAKTSNGGQPIDPNHFRIWWEVKRKRSRIFFFGLFSSGVATAVALMQAFDKVCPPWNIVLLCLGIVLAGCAAAGLFNYFNKV